MRRRDSYRGGCHVLNRMLAWISNEKGGEELWILPLLLPSYVLRWDFMPFVFLVLLILVIYSLLSPLSFFVIIKKFKNIN